MDTHIKHLNSAPNFPSRVIILGATGFVGNDLNQHLQEQGVETLPLSSQDIDLQNAESVALLKDIIQQDDALVIVSALTPDKGKDIRTLMINLTMMENLCAVLAEKACAHIVYISSDAVYADGIDLISESSCCNPSSFHGLMHLARERMLNNTLIGTEIPCLLLRPCSLYGANDTHNSYGPNRFLRTALQDGEIKLFGHGEEKRDHVYIKDFSRIIGLSLAKRSMGTVNVATGTSISFFDVAQEIAQLCGEIQILPQPRSNPITHIHFDVSESVKAFPDFQYISLLKGISDIFS